jgi:hypothetical protein
LVHCKRRLTPCNKAPELVPWIHGSCPLHMYVCVHTRKCVVKACCSRQVFMQTGLGVQPACLMRCAVVYIMLLQKQGSGKLGGSVCWCQLPCCPSLLWSALSLSAVSPGQVGFWLFGCQWGYTASFTAYLTGSLYGWDVLSSGCIVYDRMCWCGPVDGSLSAQQPTMCQLPALAAGSAGLPCSSKHCCAALCCAVLPQLSLRLFCNKNCPSQRSRLLLLALDSLVSTASPVWERGITTFMRGLGSKGVQQLLQQSASCGWLRPVHALRQAYCTLYCDAVLN